MALIPEAKRNVAVLGASPKPERYSNQAVRLLASLDYRPIPVNPAFAAASKRSRNGNSGNKKPILAPIRGIHPSVIVIVIASEAHGSSQ